MFFLDVILAVGSKVVDYIGTPIYNELSYLFTHGKHMKNLKHQIEKLKGMRDDVRYSVDSARRNGGTIKITVSRWLEDVDQIIAEAEQLDHGSSVDNSSLSCWYPSWRARYKLSKEAFKKTLNVTELQNRSQTEDVSIRLPPLNVDFLPDLATARHESVNALLGPLPERNGASGSASTSNAKQKIVLHIKTVDEIISQQTGNVKQIIFQQQEAVKRVFHALQDDDCDIIGIYGMGGIGKTTFAKEIGRMAKGCSLFDEVAMAVVSQNPDIRKIQGELADVLGLYFIEETEKGRAGRLYERLTKKRTLIMLDDVWASIDLTSIGIPINGEGRGCKILLTTRQKTMCSIMGFQKGSEIPVKLLSEEASLGLLNSNTGVNDSSASHLDNVSLDIARECRGLPLAIVTVGRALRDKNMEEWKAALQQLQKSKPLNVSDVETDVFSCLRLSFNHLRSEEAKQCFLLASLFPEDHDIKFEDIVRYGTGKGVFRNIDFVEEARRQTRWIMRSLIDACLLMNSNKEDCVKMHDMVRDFAIFISSEEEYGFLVKSGLHLTEWPNRETFEQDKTISVMYNKIQALPRGLNCPKLEMLLLGENEGIEVIPETFFEGMTKIKVLDISERIGVHVLKRYFNPSTAPEMLNCLTFPSSMTSLVDLRTLYLNHCKLGDMSVIGKLRRLEILSLYGSDIRKLPSEMGELVNLRLLDLNFCQKLKKIPANLISRLTRLEELYMAESFSMWAVAGTKDQEPNEACLSELTSLPHLTNLCVQVVNPKSFPQNFHLPNLEKFEISIGIGYSSLTCYPKSRILYLREIKRSLAQGVMSLIQTTQELTIFCLYDEFVKGIIDVDQGGLSSLKSLTVTACMEIVFMMDAPARDAPAILANLENLHLKLLDSMEDVCRLSLPKGSLSKLKVLNVESCRRIDIIVTGLMLQRLSNLEEILVMRCDEVTKIFGHIETPADTETLLLSNLKKISLSGLPKLKTIWSRLDLSSSPAVSLHKLTEVEISDCRNLDYVFPLCVSESFLLLEVLKLQGCLVLEAIVEKGGKGLLINSNQQHACFPKLRVIEVKGCDSLKSLFSVAEARSLRELREIKAGASRALTELISHVEKGGEEKEDSIIMLPKLCTIQLTDLSSMNRLCANSFTVDLPSLEDLVIEKCPKIENTVSDAAKLGFEDVPMLKTAQIGEQRFHGEAIKQLFPEKINRDNKKGKTPLEWKPLLKRPRGNN